MYKMFDFECVECGKIFESLVKEEEVITCKECNGSCKIVWTKAPNDDWFKPYWDPDFDIKPIYVRSKGHLKDLCLKYDVTSRALGDVRNIKEI